MSALARMSTSDLVDALAADLPPRPPAWTTRRLAIGLLGGAFVSLAATLALWGPRPDFAAALATGPFWAKLGFADLLAASGVAATARFARPGGVARGATACAYATIAVMACLAGLQLARAPAGAQRPLLMGSTAASCPWLIMLLALPILAGGIWALRAMAPTRLSRAGAELGLAAGAGAAVIYALSCDESAIPFVLIWYGLGMAAPTAIGALLGPRLLRW